MAIPRLHKEASIFDEQNPISGGIDDAAKCATDYITEISGDGIWVTPEDAKPVGGQAVATTSGVHITDSVDIVRDGEVALSIGESIVLISSKPQSIGGEDAYILYYDSDEDGVPDSIAIGGENVTVGGGKALSELLSDVSDALVDVDALQSGQVELGETIESTRTSLEGDIAAAETAAKDHADAAAAAAGAAAADALGEAKASIAASISSVEEGLGASIAENSRFIDAHFESSLEDGLFVHQSGDADNGVRVTDEVEIIRDGASVASYGESVRIGPADGPHVSIDDDSMDFYAGAESGEVDTRVGYVAVDQESNESLFYMTKAVIVSDLRFGDWQWTSRENGNLNLRWIGSGE